MELALHDIESSDSGSFQPLPVERPRFERVYRELVPFVFRMLRRFGVAEPEVEDAAQEVFLVVHRRLVDYDSTKGSVKSWVYGIARGIAANRRRKSQRRSQVDRHALGDAPERGRGEPERQAQNRQARVLVERFLATIGEDRRVVFELVEIEGMRGPEVAELLDVKLNTVYTRLRAARLAFKEYVEVLRSTEASIKGGDHARGA